MSFMSGLWLAVSRKIQQLNYAERMYLLDTKIWKNLKLNCREVY